MSGKIAAFPLVGALFVLGVLLVLSPAAGAVGPPALTGTVTDPDGRPLAGVDLVVFTRVPSPTSYVPSAAPLTGADGAFVIPGLPSGRLRLQGFRPGHLRETLTVCRRGEPVHLVLRSGGGPPRGPDGRPVPGPGLFTSAEPGCDDDGKACPPGVGAEVEGCGRGISGWIFDAAGAPLAQARVQAEAASWVETTRLTEEDGFFALSGLPAGPVQVRVERAGYETVQGTVEPLPGELRLTAVLALDAACDCLPLPLSGHVTGPDGKPIEAALVVERTSKGVGSAADGSFELHPASREPTTVWAYKPGFAPTAIDVDPAAGTAGRIEIRMQTEAEP